jgi:hypothetical protein
MVLGAVVAVAGCATTTSGSGTVAADAATGGGSAAAGTPTTLPVPSDTAAPTATPEPDPTATTPAPPGRRVQVGGVSVPVPGNATAKSDGAYLCLTLTNDTGCSLEVIDIRATRAQGGSVGNPNPGGQYGWWWGSDVPSCGSAGSPVTRETVVTKGFKPVGAKQAAYASYLVSCQDSDLDFDPQIWWLPTSQIAFRQRTTVAGTSEAIAPILAGVTFGP